MHELLVYIFEGSDMRQNGLVVDPLVNSGGISSG